MWGTIPFGDDAYADMAAGTAAILSRAFVETVTAPTASPAQVSRSFLEITGANTAVPAVVSRLFLEVVYSTVYLPPEPLMPTPLTSLMCFGVPRTRQPPIYGKPLGGMPPQGFSIPDFDIWRPGYAGAKVQVMMAGTTQPAPVFTDLLLTQPALNPQILQAQTDANGTTYGSWLQPIYTYVPYYLLINETDTTGVVYPPLTTLAGADASYATIAAPRGGFGIPMRNWLDRVVHVANFGTWATTAGSLANTITLEAAIGAAAAQGGASVVIPAGTFPIQPFTLPEGVVVEGQSKGATTLQCQTGAPVVSLAGDGAGLRNLTLDGVVLAGSSIGVDATGVFDVVFEHVLIQRFQTGMRAKGLEDSVWTDFSISGCGTAADIRGDTDAATTGRGTQVKGILWDGGAVSLCTTAGVTFEVIDLPVFNIVLNGVQFENNQCSALNMVGARDMKLSGCGWDSNLINWSISDGFNTAQVAINTCRNILFDGGTVNGNQVSGAKCNFSGVCQNVRVRDASVVNCSIVLLSPQNQVSFQDCYIDATTSITGTLTLYGVLRTSDTSIVNGLTADNSPVTAWALQLRPGQVAVLDVQAVAKQENGVNFGTFWEAAGAEEPGATLNFMSGTSAFGVPAVLQGQTSKAVALINAKAGTIASGALTLIDITGTFQSGETITDSTGGQAQVSGPMAFANAALDATGQIHVRAPTVSNTSGYAVLINTSGQMLQVQVQGAAGHSVAWQSKVRVVVN